MSRVVVLGWMAVLIAMIVFLGTEAKTARSALQVQLDAEIANSTQLMRERDACMANWNQFVDYAMQARLMIVAYVPALAPGIEPPAATRRLPPYISVDQQLQLPIDCTR